MYLYYMPHIYTLYWVAEFRDSVQPIISESTRICLTDASKEISDNVAGYIAKKLIKLCNSCCDQLLTNNGVSPYVKLLSRGGLKEPSAALGNFVAHGFAVLNAAANIIQDSSLPSRFVAEDLLKTFLCNEGFVCEQHEDIANNRAIRNICNVFLNNQRKRRTETVVKDGVVALKQSKRSKGNWCNFIYINRDCVFLKGIYFQLEFLFQFQHANVLFVSDTLDFQYLLQSDFAYKW